MCRGGQLGVRHHAQGPAFLIDRDPQLPGGSFSFNSLSRPGKSSYNDISSLLVDVPCVLVNFLGILVYALLYRRLYEH